MLRKALLKTSVFVLLANLSTVSVYSDDNKAQKFISNNGLASFLSAQLISHVAYFMHNRAHLWHQEGDVFLGHNLSTHRDKFWKLHDGIYLSKALLSSPPGAGVAVADLSHDQALLEQKKDPSKQRLEEVLTLAAGPIIGAVVHWVGLRSCLGKKGSKRAKMHALLHMADLAITLPKNKSGIYPKIFGAEIKTDGSQILEKFELQGPAKFFAHTLPIVAWSAAAYFLLVRGSDKKTLKNISIDLLTDVAAPMLVNAAYANSKPLKALGK